MANTILTPTMVTRAALIILHQKLNFVGRINRQYDDQFAKTGAKIGTALLIRLPNQYTVSTGASLSTQTTSETSTTLNVTTQAHVDTGFTSVDLTMSLQDFSERILEPAMSVLAAYIENDALSMINDVYQTFDNRTANSLTLAAILGAGVLLDDALAPRDNSRTALLNNTDSADLVNALKALFQDSKAIAEQYKEGMMGRTAGFEFYQNSLLQSFTGGTQTSGSITVNSTITTTTATSSIMLYSSAGLGTLKVGDVFTIATLNKVHPESKTDTGILQQFVVTSLTSTGTLGSVSFQPAMLMSGAGQNVISTAISAQLLTKITGNAENVRQSLVFHKDAFTFATADLLMPNDVHFKSRQVLDGISMRIVQQYTINDDALPCRIDVLYGYRTIRAQLAAKIWS